MSTTSANSALQIGRQLAELCTAGKSIEAIETLYADDVVSVEPMEAPGFAREARGKEAILGKNMFWKENFEAHSMRIDGPFPHGEDRFAVIFDMDVTNKMANQRMRMHEIGVYTVQDGKIVREEFFYPTGG